MLENSACFPTDFGTPPSSPSAYAHLAPCLLLGRGVKAVENHEMPDGLLYLLSIHPERAIDLGAFAADSGAEIGRVWDNG